MYFISFFLKNSQSKVIQKYILTLWYIYSTAWWFTEFNLLNYVTQNIVQHSLHDLHVQLQNTDYLAVGYKKDLPLE